MRYFFFGNVRPDPDGHVRITQASDMRVQGGTKGDHDKAVEILTKCKERMAKHGVEKLPEIVENVIREVEGG